MVLCDDRSSVVLQGPRSGRADVEPSLASLLIHATPSPGGRKSDSANSRCRAIPDRKSRGGAVAWAAYTTASRPISEVRHGCQETQVKRERRQAPAHASSI